MRIHAQNFDIKSSHPPSNGWVLAENPSKYIEARLVHQGTTVDVSNSNINSQNTGKQNFFLEYCKQIFSNVA